MLRIIFCCIPSYWVETCKLRSKSSCSLGTSRLISPSAWCSSSIGHVEGRMASSPRFALVDVLQYISASTIVWPAQLYIYQIWFLYSYTWRDEVMRDLTWTNSLFVALQQSHLQQVGLATLTNLERFFLIWWLLIQKSGKAPRIGRSPHLVTHHSCLLMSLLDLVVLHSDQKPWVLLYMVRRKRNEWSSGYMHL